MDTALPDAEVRLSLSTNVSSNNNKKEVLRNQRVSNMDLLHTLFHSDTEAISTDFLSRKMRKVYGTSSSESNWAEYPIEENTGGEINE